MRCWIAAVLALMMSSTSIAARVFQDEFSARFTLESSGTVIGSTLWSLTAIDGSRLVYQSESTATGIFRLLRDDHIVERSEWRMQGDALRPYGYRYDRTGKKRRKRIEVAFDWRQGSARNTYKGKTWTMRVPTEAMDKLGYVLAMMYDLGTGKRELEYRIADGGKLKTYRLKAIGEEDIRTRIGSLNTLKVLRVRDDKRRRTTFWCAPRLRFLPVKVEHREKDGSVITLLIESVRGIDMHEAAPAGRND